MRTTTDVEDRVWLDRFRVPPTLAGPAVFNLSAGADAGCGGGGKAEVDDLAGLSGRCETLRPIAAGRPAPWGDQR